MGNYSVNSVVGSLGSGHAPPPYAGKGQIGSTGKASIAYSAPPTGNVDCCCGALPCDAPETWTINGSPPIPGGGLGSANCRTFQYTYGAEYQQNYNFIYTSNEPYNPYYSATAAAYTGPIRWQYGNQLWLPGLDLTLESGTGPPSVTPEAGSIVRGPCDCTSANGKICTELFLIALKTYSIAGGPTFGPGRRYLYLYEAINSEGDYYLYPNAMNYCAGGPPNEYALCPCCWQDGPEYPTFVYNGSELMMGTGTNLGVFTAGLTWSGTVSGNGLVVFDPDGLMIAPQLGG